MSTEDILKSSRQENASTSQVSARSGNAKPRQTIARKLLRAYFNYIYNPVYDFTTARLDRYCELQEKCIRKLSLESGNSVLCVGIGTGNEIGRIIQAAPDAVITGIDYSGSALEKALRKSRALGVTVQTQRMDARKLEFPSKSFDRVFCFHVTDFIPEADQVTAEILRVVKDGGRFVITYPSGKEGLRSGYGLVKNSVDRQVRPGKPKWLAFLQFFSRVWMGFVYLPLMFRPERKVYTREELVDMVNSIRECELIVEVDPVYQDFIICGTAK